MMGERTYTQAEVEALIDTADDRGYERGVFHGFAEAIHEVRRGDIDPHKWRNALDRGPAYMAQGIADEISKVETRT